MKTTNKLSTTQITDAEIGQVSGGRSLQPIDSQSEPVTLPIKPIRYYTQALGEDGGDLPDLLTM